MCSSILKSMEHHRKHGGSKSSKLLKHKIYTFNKLKFENEFSKWIFLTYVTSSVLLSILPHLPSLSAEHNVPYNKVKLIYFLGKVLVIFGGVIIDCQSLFVIQVPKEGQTSAMLTKFYLDYEISTLLKDYANNKNIRNGEILYHEASIKVKYKKNLIKAVLKKDYINKNKINISGLTNAGLTGHMDKLNALEDNGICPAPR